VNKYLGKEVIISNFQVVLVGIGDLSFLSIFSRSSTIEGGFGLGFDLVCLLGAIILTP